jgi:prepilin-type N-terminal cleavage/methylation domain-containing protein
MTRTTKRAARRAAFTLVEMLVVVTIVAILLSLTTAAALKLIGAQQQFNTQTELTRLEGDLVRAYRSAADKFRKEPIPPSGPLNSAYASVTNMAGGDRNLARVIWTKLRLKQTFPNNFAEALYPGNPSINMPALSYYHTKLNGLGYFATYDVPSISPFSNISALNYQPQPWESSVCLLWALQRGEDGPGLQESDIGTGSLKDFGQVTPNPLKPNPSAGLTPLQQPVKGLVDNWGTPLYFCRWPVNSLLLNPVNQDYLKLYPPLPPGTGYPHTGDSNDPDDPSGLLESPSWQATASLTTFQKCCHPLATPVHTTGNEAFTYRIYPLIVSAGADKQLGLDTNTITPPVGTGFFATSPPGNSFVNDNIYPALASPK